LVDTLHKGEISVCLSLSLFSSLFVCVHVHSTFFFPFHYLWIVTFGCLISTFFSMPQRNAVASSLVLSVPWRNEMKIPEIAHPFRVALHGGAHENLRSITRFSTLSRIYSRIVIVKEVTVFGDNVFSNGGGLHQIWTRFGHQVIRCHFHRYLG